MTKTNCSKVLICTFIGITLVVCGLLCGCQKSDYKPTLKASTVDPSALIKSGTLTVGVNASNPPLASKTSKIQGIDVDVASAIADELGLKVEVVDVGSSSESSLVNKKVDVVMGMDANGTSNDAWFSPIYIQSGSALFAMNANTALPVKGDSSIIEGQMGSSAVLKAQNQFNVSNVKVKTDIAACFDDLSAKSVNFVAADAVIGSYSSFVNNIGAKLVGMLQRPSGYCASVLKSNTTLQNSINTAIETLKSRGTFDVISNKWLATSVSLDSLPKTEGADNEAVGTDVDSGVYAEVSNTAIQN